MRHRENAVKLWRGLEMMGLELYIQDQVNSQFCIAFLISYFHSWLPVFLFPFLVPNFPVPFLVTNFPILGSHLISFLQAIRLPTVTAVKIPYGINWKAITDYLMKK